MIYASRFLLAALLLPLSLSACDWFDKKKPPLVGERIPVFSDRKDLEPDKWVRVGKWGDASDARAVLMDAIERAKGKVSADA